MAIKNINDMDFLENSDEVLEYKYWKYWATMFYKRMYPNENFNEIINNAEKGYLKTNPKAKTYVNLKKHK